MKAAKAAKAARAAAALLAALAAPAAPTALTAQTIDTIVVQNATIFDRDGDGPGPLADLANALHVRTRPAIIRRTLLVNPGDPYDSARVAESERALRALGVFRRVALDTGRLNGRFALVVSTADGWSTKPQASYSSTGGDETWEIGLVEENFLGTASQFAVSYRRTPDRRQLEALYLNPHFLWRRVPLLLRYGDYSDGRRAFWRFGPPFFETAARFALATDGEAADERILRFTDGLLTATPQRRVLRFGIAGGIAPRATSRDYVRLWAGAEWRREDFAPDPATPSPYSTFGTAGAGLELGHARFQVLEHLNAYSRREDIDLSPTLRVGVWVAPRAWGYPSGRAGVAPEFRGQVSALWRGGFAVLRAQARGVVSDSGRVRGSLLVASQNLPRQTWIVFVEGGVAERPAPGGEFDLWLEGRGPRVFGAHAFTGTRMVWGTLENRILAADDVWGLVGIGLAPFVDWGGAWYADEDPRIGGNVGVALRFGPTRAAGGEAGEIAVGYRFGDGVDGGPWGLTVRKGFVFR